MINKAILTIAYIGNGKSTNRYHLPFALTRKDKIRVKSIWQRTVRSGQWATIPGVIYTQDLDEILSDTEIRLVVIATPSDAHYEMTKKVLDAGKHCVCEKPFTQTSSEAEELFALAEKKGVMLQCYQNRRFDSDFLTVQKVIGSGKLGKLLEMEMHFDYYRPEVPENTEQYSRKDSFLYGHGCHTLDQVISCFGAPVRVIYDIRSLLGTGRMNDYFDLDLFYDDFKVSVKSSYFRVKARPSFIVNGRRGMFVKETKDRQETDLKHFYMPTNSDFGLDLPEHYGILTYYDHDGIYHEEKVPTIPGNYAFYYDALYETIINGAAQLVTKEQTLLQIRLLEEGISKLEGYALCNKKF